MSPKLPDLLTGLAMAAMAPAPPEAGGDYAAARMGLIATLLVLAAQEAERGPAARRWENDAIAALLTETRDGYGPTWGEAADPEAEAPGTEPTWSALDARNAQLRRALIQLHEAAERRRDAALQRRILALYEAMAHARRLELTAG
jgi:hypothetical protein